METALSFQQARILIVDDESSIVTLLEEMLTMAGYTQVRTTTDECRAISIYQEWQPDLVLLDIHMPDLDGFKVMAALREIEQDYLPILVLTADATRDIQQRVFEEGAKDFLRKPFDPVETLSRMRNIIEVRLLHQALRRQNNLLETEVRRRTQELHETRLEIVRRLGRAVEYRDNETGLHVIRMSHYAASLGRVIGMSPSECDMLLNSCPMHDIGKIGIPDHILLKPTQLDSDEWVIMQSHTTIGAELLAGHHSGLMRMAYQTALTHHEKWDGSGYPHGLRGEAIPLVGRITAICDVFDALTSERPYKNAWPVEDAVAEIRNRRGTQFDPELVDRFDTILPEILDIHRQYPEPHSAA
jgi:putative two-component system response regulator